jgi:hypothetical protein
MPFVYDLPVACYNACLEQVADNPRPLPDWIALMDDLNDSIDNGDGTVKIKIDSVSSLKTLIGRYFMMGHTIASTDMYPGKPEWLTDFWLAVADYLGTESSKDVMIHHTGAAATFNYLGKTTSEIGDLLDAKRNDYGSRTTYRWLKVKRANRIAFVKNVIRPAVAGALDDGWIKATLVAGSARGILGIN